MPEICQPYVNVDFFFKCTMDNYLTILPYLNGTITRVGLQQLDGDYKVIVTVFTVTSVPIICHSLLGSLSLALSVCPAVKAYISVTMDWILMKLGGSVGTLSPIDCNQIS